MAQSAENLSENSRTGAMENDLPPLKVKKEPATEEQLKHLVQSPGSSARLTTTTAVTTSTASVASSNMRTMSRDMRSINGQMSITAYFSKKNAARNDKYSSLDNEKKDSDEKSRIDLESIKGVFGWTTLENVHVPYILRMGEKFTAVRIIEKSLLKKFLQALPPDVYSCTYIKSYFITENEAKLLNEINMKHCERQFGHEHFTVKDLVVQLTDVVQLYKFLSTCYTKLVSSSTIREKENPCGIVKIGGSPIPYVCRDAVKYVPLALFGREVQTLETKGEKLEPWELSYMKFCCRVANISNEFLQEYGTLVVSLDDVKQLASEAVLFEDWWPSAHDNRVNKSRGNGTGVTMACFTRNGEGNVLNNIQKEMSVNTNVVYPCAVPTSRYYDENLKSRCHKEPVSGCNKLRILQASVSEKTPAIANVTNGLQSPRPHQSFTNVLYPFSTNVLSQSSSGLIPSTMASHNPQPYIFNGQWWGAFGSNSDGSSCFSSRGISSLDSWVAHCPQGPTQCSPGGNLSELQHNSISEYVQSIGQVMKSNQPYSWPLSLNSQQAFHPSRNGLGSTFSVLPKNVARNDSISRKNSVDLERTKHSNWSMDVSKHSNEHLLNVISKSPSDNSRITRHISANSNVTSSKSKDTINSNGNNTDGNTRSITEGVHHASQSFLSHYGYERGLSLVQHLTRPEELSGVLATSHRHVVAPGSSQSVISKMSSPKPANQVPTSVAFENRDRHPIASWRPLTPALDMGATLLNNPDYRHTTVSSSKLQELLCSEESKTSSKSKSVDLSSKHEQSKPPLYKVQDVIVGGMHFHGVNSAANAVGTAMMVPVTEVEKNLSPRVTAQLCEHILTKILQINLFECNREQEEVLRKVMMNNGYDPQVNNFSPLKLIRVEDLTRNLPQVIYTLAKLQIQHQMDSVNEAKRARRELGVST